MVSGRPTLHLPGTNTSQNILLSASGAPDGMGLALPYTTGARRDRYHHRVQDDRDGGFLHRQQVPVKLQDRAQGREDLCGHLP
jgi:hypothetical protein